MLKTVKRAILRGFKAAGYSIIKTTALADINTANEREIEAKALQTQTWAAAKEKEIEDKVLQTQTWAAAKDQAPSGRWVADKDMCQRANLERVPIPQERDVDSRLPGMFRYKRDL
jgi:hypothetical protein